MTPPLSSSSAAIAAASWETWLTERRIPLSVLLFATLVLADMFLLGVRPRDVLDWHDLGTVLGEALVLVGLALRTWAAGTLAKGTALTRSGPYSLVRNPLYVGSFLMMFGFCTLVHDWQSIWFIVGPIAAIYWLQVRQEERKLAARFPDEWPLYAEATPRFLPRRFPGAGLREWSLRLWVRNREYQALLASAAAMGGLAIWRSMTG